MKKVIKNTLITVGIVAVIVGIAALMNLRPIETFEEKYAGVDLEADVEGAERDGTYTKYLAMHADAASATKIVPIDLYTYTNEGDVEVYKNYEGEEKVLYTGNNSKVTWEVNVPEAGFYNIEIEYLAPDSRGVAVERGVYINDELPFDDALNVSFTRIWKDGGEVRMDNQRNEIRPTQVEEFAWQTARFRDDRGYVAEPYKFYLEKGVNSITFKSENEPLVLKKVSLCPIEKLDTYEEYLAKQPADTSSAVVKEYLQQIEGEDSTFRSESSLYAKYDRSSPTTSPCDITRTVLNYVGGETWKSSGQWIEWEFSVPEDGYYNITVKGRQNYSRGSVSNRIVYIDGVVPFEELKEVSFEYNNDWNYLTLADESGEAYDFYLTKGTHTIRLEACLGGIGPVLSKMEDSTFRLNQIYKKLLVYTGPNPDKYRDYKVHTTYPEVIKAMDLEAKRLFKIVDDAVAYSGQKSGDVATSQTLAQQLERFVKKPNKITLEFINFKDNITAIGTSALNMSETKLDIDYITISGADAVVEKKQTGVLASAWHEIKSFVVSFFIDYNSVGNVYENDEEVVTVWVLTGRDQGTILKSMIDDTFTPQTGIKVNVEIVGQDALLNAVIAGRGPNVALSVGADQPVNYALRHAAEDITQFEGWEEVLSHYASGSYEQYRLEDGIYGVPETMTFNVMFYREDVLEELGLEVPTTWKELIEILPTIQGNNLSVGIPTAAGSSTSTPNAAVPASGDLSMYFALLYQNGGDMYNEKGTKTTVDDEAGMKAFDDYVRYFNDYGLPQIYDFVSRFRSGEMPIGIQPYSTYNTLVVSAPEIRGLWDFTLLPGTERVDENGDTYVDRSSFIVGNATMMIANESESLKKKSWEFMKWWAQTDTQVRFGREIEALLGSSARYATANRDAFVQLSWSADNLEVLNAQWDQTFGIREVPGGYFTGRHISNAIRKVLFEKEDTRETIIDYSIRIDEEIEKKRKEFGLPLE